MSPEWLAACQRSCDDSPVGIDDICGAGVVIGFVGAAVIAIAFMNLNYLCTYDPNDSIALSANPVDERLLKALRRWPRKRLARFGLLPKGSSHRLNDALVEILTGLGILVAGFISLPVLKGAHWQMVCYLAWFATVTHLSGLSIMSRYLHGCPLERASRMILMGVLLIVLVVAMVPIAAITIATSTETGLVLTSNCDATCFFNRQFMVNNLDLLSWWPGTKFSSQNAARFVSSLLAIALMCVSFVVRLGRVTPKLLSTIASNRASISTAIQRLIMEKAEKRFSMGWQNVLWREMLIRPLLCVFLLLRACSLLWSSMIFEIIWICFLALYGWSRILLVWTELYTVQSTPFNGPEELDDGIQSYKVPRGDYNGGSWSFGQILPVFLLVTPVWGFMRSTLPRNNALESMRPTEASSDDTEVIQHSVDTLPTHVGATSISTMSNANAFPRPNLKSLEHLDKSEFGASQLAKHAFISISLVATALMAWFLAVVFRELGVSYSLSILPISMFPATAVVGAPLTTFLHMFLMTNIVDSLPSPSHRRSALLWAALGVVNGILATVIVISWAKSDAMNGVFATSLDTDDMVRLLSPNLYIIVFTTSITIFTVMAATGVHLCAVRFQSAF